MDYLSNPELGLVTHVRQPQIDMAASVDAVVTDGGLLVVEGPVGVGKTFAYLLPALLSGKRTVVSTPKKSLQDQIVLKDIPSLLRVINKDVPVPYTVVKGKSNYTCREQAEKHDPDHEYKVWVERSRHGDKAEYPGTPPAWFPKATAELCIGRVCASYNRCGYIRMKQESAQAKVVVINHHLLGNDFYFGTETLGKVVGGEYDILIIDEAHKFADGIRAAFTLDVTERSILEIGKMTANAGIEFPSGSALTPIWEDLFATVKDKHWKEPHERTPKLFDDDRAEDALNALHLFEGELSAALKKDGDGGYVLVATDQAIYLAQAQREVGELQSGIRMMQGRPRGDDEEHSASIMRNTCIYANGGYTGFNIHAAPIHLGHIVSEHFAQVKSVIMTSATLAVGGEFNHLRSVIGTTPTLTDVLPTTFDYAKQGMLYAPKHVAYCARPKKGEDTFQYDRYLQQIAEECAFLVNASGGNAFILTTANDEMQRIVVELKKRTTLPVLMQTVKNKDGTVVGDGDPQPLLKKYLDTPGAVLVGSKSFWEGVDVQGEKLSLVIIPKLPFPSMSDPIVRARRRVSESPFNSVDVVDMLIDLRQGAGRLIRTINDRGIVAILDSRVWTKPYGKQVFKALPFPASNITSDRAFVAKYLPMVKGYYAALKVA